MPTIAPPGATKNDFMREYRKALQSSSLPVTHSQERIESLLKAVETTITTTAATWIHDGEISVKAWRSIGGKGQPTLKALRALST